MKSGKTRRVLITTSTSAVCIKGRVHFIIPARGTYLPWYIFYTGTTTAKARITHLALLFTRIGRSLNRGTLGALFLMMGQKRTALMQSQSQSYLLHHPYDWERHGLYFFSRIMI